MNGRWILSNDHVIYRLVRSILPSDGDYLTYFKDSQQKDDRLKDETHQLDDLDRHYLNQSYYNGRNNSLTTSTTIPGSFGGTISALASKSIDRRTILSGLTYTVQFVNLIAFYLNILLPYNLPHRYFLNFSYLQSYTDRVSIIFYYFSKFCTQSLTDDQFQNAVAKLNTNIVYLSINQHIPVTNLLPKHTLENLNHFLTYFKEMRVKLREK